MIMLNMTIIMFFMLFCGYVNECQIDKAKKRNNRRNKKVKGFKMKLPQIRKKFEREGIKYGYCSDELAFSLNAVFAIRQSDRHSKTCIVCQYSGKNLSSSFEFSRIEISDSFIYFYMGDGKYNVSI